MGKPNRLSDHELVQVNQAIFSLRNVYESKMRKKTSNAADSPTIAEMGVLMVLGQAGKVNAKTLSNMMDITPGTLSQYISRLVKRGFVEQERDLDDRRTWWLGLTAEGEKAYKAAYSGTVLYTSDILSSLGYEEQESLHRLLVKLAHANGYAWQ